MRRRAARAVAGALAVLAVPACTVGVRRATPTPSPSTSAPPTATATPTPAACPATYAEPDPKRPRITLTFDLDGRVVTGTERVVFTPDRTVSELVFRAIPNAGTSVDSGGRLEVTSASLPMTTEQAGAPPGAPGALVRLALPAPVAAGTEVTADLAFRLTLPEADIDRLGHATDLAWWGSGHPLLAWQRGGGWATEPVVGILGETASSEAADYDVTVTAPAAYTVVGSGLATAPADAGGGRRRWRFRNAVARDIAVVAGKIETTSLAVDGVPVLIAVDPRLESGITLGPIRANVERVLRELVRLFGPYPYESLTVVALRAIGGAGVEYPGLFLVGSRRYDLVVAHELAHEWFYGLVGNNQATEPWLDESFATYAETLVNDSAEDHLDALSQRADVRLPMTYWNRNQKSYGTIVYSKGGAALRVAREAGPAAAFDRAIRCYVNREAYGIATAADLEAALAHLPRSLQVLRDAGALATR